MGSINEQSAAPPEGVATHSHEVLLTVDVEDYFHVEAFSGSVKKEDWGSYSSRVERNTDRLLELFDRVGARATFFVLGWVAERTPGIVRAIVASRHEVACHSYWHRRVDTLTREEFMADTVRARNVIEDIAGRPVTGYRAPTFSVVNSSLWALQVLADLGFKYDSSIYPIRHDVYGVPGWPMHPTRVDLESASIVEVPPPTVELFGQGLPYGGGGYLRIFPLAYHSWALRRVVRARPGMIYVHPWELDPDQPRIPAPLKSRLRHYTGLTKLEDKLARLIAEHRCVSIEDHLRDNSVAAHLTSDALSPA